MSLLRKIFFIAALIQVCCFVCSESAVWRSVANAVLSCVKLSPDSSLTTLDACNSTCISDHASCLSYAFSSSLGCMIYGTRFGFGTCELEINNDYYYYEKPIDIDDHYNNVLNASQVAHGVETFLSRYRNGIPGYVGIIEGTDTLVTKYNVETAEDCAKYCTRRRGLIDETTGARCNSFNYQPTTKTCYLTSVTLDETHDIDLGDGSKYYYDRLKGSGCWITQTACRHQSGEYIGNFNVSDINYEYECMDLAKYYHETICDNKASVSTSAVWGGNGESVYDAWNPWDYTTGCVVDFGDATCYGTPRNNNGSRFEKKFRDSIGEDQYAAWFSADYCFDRAQVWYDYCNFTDSEQQINLSFPDTGSYKIFPVTTCICDDKGKKIDIATNRAFCARNTSTGDYCWRSTQQDYWSYADVLCDDASCPEYNSTTHNASATHCFLISFHCSSGYISSSSPINYYDTNYYETPCPSSKLITSIGSSSTTCNYTEADCLAEAEYYHTMCGNSDSDASEQAVVFYQPTGAMAVYPPFSAPASTTLIRGIYGDASYTTYNSSDISLISLSNGHWMSFTALETSVVRQITVFWSSSQESTLTLAFYEGTGTTGNTKLASTTVTFPASTDSSGDYIQFPIDSVDVTSGSTYTWQVTSADATNDAGYIGYIPGDLYGNGEGDLTFDYIFVEWIEYDPQVSQTLLAATSSPGKSRPWFEIWFIIGLILFFLFAAFLLYLHYQRKRNEKKAEEEERQMQADAKKRARLQLQSKNDGNENENENDDKYVALNSGDSPRGNSSNQANHVNASSIIEEEPNMNAETRNDDNENDNDDNENDNDNDNDNDGEL